MAGHYGLRRSLARSAYAPLADLINWEATPPRSLIRVLLFAMLGAAAIIVFFATALYFAMLVWAVVDVTLSDTDAQYKEVPALEIGAMIVLPVLGFFLFVFATRWIITTVSRPSWREMSKFPEMSLFSAKKPTLYLRRFAEENQELESAHAAAADPRVRLGVALERRLGAADRTLERALSNAVSRVGPLVGLSDPQRRRRTGQARRIAIRGDVWQEAVELLLRHANLVVMEFTGGASLDWEAETVIKGTNLPILIWIPHLSHAMDRIWLKNLIARAQTNLDHSADGGLLVFVGGDRQSTIAMSLKPTYEGLQRAIVRILEQQGVMPVRQKLGLGVPPLQRAAAVVSWLAPKLAVAAPVAAFIFWAQAGYSELDRLADQTYAGMRRAVQARIVADAPDR